MQDDDRALFQLRVVLPQHLHEHRRRLARQDAMRPQQHDAGPAATAKGKQTAEVEIMCQQDEPVPARPLEDLRVSPTAAVQLALGMPAARLLSPCASGSGSSCYPLGLQP